MSHHIVTGHTTHQRLHPLRHGFTYPLYMLDIDLHELETHSTSAVLSYNTFNLFSLHAEDYLSGQPSEHISKRLRYIIETHTGKPVDADEIRLLTTPRFLAKTFNPISLYFVYKKQNLTIIVAEVTNTFKEKHVYILPVNTGKQAGKYHVFTHAKSFYVSPFSPDEGDFHFFIQDIKTGIDIQVHYLNNGKTDIVATLKGNQTPVTTPSLVWLAVRYPLSAIKTMPRILYQASILHYKKKHYARRKPMQTDPLTIKNEPGTWLQRRYIHLFQRTLKKAIREGHLKVRFPDGTVHDYGDQTKDAILLTIYSPNFFSRIVYHSDIGLAQSYVKQEWECADISQLLALFIRNRDRLFSSYSGSVLSNLFYGIKHRLSHNSLKNSKDNIYAHYDLGNDFYALFLDSSMTYSCAYYTKANMSLEEAQEEKLNKIIQKLNLRSDHHVLEIGTGWGALAIKIAEKTNCTVTSLTLSKAQYDYATQLIKEKGLSEKITVLLQDYRHHHGHYDRIVSIEMIEAVGYDYLRTYFKTCDKLLKPHGLIMIQGITMTDQLYQQYINKTDFIQQYIFPGSHLPSLTHIQDILTQDTGLMIEDLENIGPHYALTLAAWKQRFLSNKKDIESKYGHEFIRLWVMYFSYCESAFQERHIHNLQLVLTRSHNTYLINHFKKEYR